MDAKMRSKCIVEQKDCFLYFDDPQSRMHVDGSTGTEEIKSPGSTTPNFLIFSDDYRPK
ncbi:hypothetical protein ROZALSC1DRAFT_28286, partial [Rozella allomycis CSF55]